MPQPAVHRADLALTGTTVFDDVTMTEQGQTGYLLVRGRYVTIVKKKQVRWFDMLGVASGRPFLAARIAESFNSIR